MVGWGAARRNKGLNAGGAVHGKPQFSTGVRGNSWGRQTSSANDDIVRSSMGEDILHCRGMRWEI